tara:strand:+ start:1182 stop:2657 length:1476 start_codon:yes stop_codon:yes gene_type:complete
MNFPNGILVTTLALGMLQCQDPPLPAGLGGQEAKPTPTQQEPEPGLPAGLGSDPEPGLPAGLQPGAGEATESNEQPLADTFSASRFTERLGLTGFFETRLGARTQKDPYERDLSISEARLRLELDRQFDRYVLKVGGDLIVDPLLGSWQPDLESGHGFFDLREASIATSPLSWLDLKLGRQVLTWGTGDLLFINDLFPKDWVSFFVGRDDEYLKAPSDALRIGMFSELANIEFVVTPRFDADRFIRGDRVSYYNPMLGRQAGRDAVQDPQQPDGWFTDPEFSARVYRNLAGFELAAYGYVGRWKSPGGFDPITARGTFPQLSVYGASARTQLLGGIANVEAGYYDSRQDPGGRNPLIENSQMRVLVGFERDLPELANSLTVGAQYYLEAMANHDNYLATLAGGTPARDELRHVVTLRVSKLLLEQRLRISVFAYVSPSDHDMYLRPNASYTIDDSWSVSVGANIFAGEDNDTFFGQFDRNTNVYAAVRVSF